MKSIQNRIAVDVIYSMHDEFWFKPVHVLWMKIQFFGKWSWVKKKKKHSVNHFIIFFIKRHYYFATLQALLFPVGNGNWIMSVHTNSCLLCTSTVYNLIGTFNFIQFHLRVSKTSNVTSRLAHSIPLKWLTASADVKMCGDAVWVLPSVVFVRF